MFLSFVGYACYYMDTVKGDVFLPLKVSFFRTQKIDFQLDCAR